MHFLNPLMKTVIILLFTIFTLYQMASGDGLKSEEPPNVIIIFVDDMGYADISPFGAKEGLTPHLDKMAEGGMKFTNFYSSFATCTRSRASLLTGTYSARLGIRGNFLPNDNEGLNPQETTIAELLKQKDYRTAAYGKWHLGDNPKFMPLNQGFDEFYGFPYSHDMWPYHPQEEKWDFPPLPLYEGTNVVNPNVQPKDIKNMTADFTGKAVDFITRNKENPFFIYLAYPLPHVPLVVSEEFEDKTGLGIYEDVIAELDWGIGQIFNSLKENGIDENTLVVFTSDNGPWTWYGEHGGSAGPLRGHKGTVFEGGYRVPSIMRWPAKIPKGTVNDEISATIDLLPTIANAAQAKLPNVKIDGKDIMGLLTGEAKSTPHEAYFYNKTAVRAGKWKLVLPHKSNIITAPGKNGHLGERKRVDIPLSLYNLKEDIGETNNLVEEYPEIVSQLKATLNEHNAELEANMRSIGKVKEEE